MPQPQPQSQPQPQPAVPVERGGLEGAVWDKESSIWLYAAVDIIEALLKSKEPRACWSCQGAAELARVDSQHPACFAEVAQAGFDAADAQPGCRGAERGEKGGTIIFERVEISPQTKLRPCIEISRTLLVALAGDGALTRIRVDAVGKHFVRQTRGERQMIIWRRNPQVLKA